MKTLSVIFLFVFFFLLISPTHHAHSQSRSTLKYDTTLYDKMQWREIGPFRGGRSVAVAGHKDLPLTFYFGATGGGIWRTDDGGNTWINVSDGYLKIGIVGAIEIAGSDANVIYAGTGEACIRGNTMPGEGMYKSTDAGKTWKHAGLGDAQTISKVRVHPKNEDLVYVAAFGHVFGRSSDRGVYRSKDGSKTWEKILYKNDKTGAVDLVLDPNNPRIIYAAMWEAYRTPWSLSSGGPGSGIWKSPDGGDTWKDLSHSRGLPGGILGKIGLAASPAKDGLVWAMVEADSGGLFRSDDGGGSWRRVNEDRRLRQRAWYYTHVYADPKNPETVYILNTGFYKSIDGGKTLTALGVPHGDNHDLWIDPGSPLRMVEANDGSVNVSYNGGKTWTAQDIPTAQFYHVTLDSQFPYQVYGAQQDNSTIGIASRTTEGGIDREDWYDVGGGESGYIAVDPRDPNVVYAGSYDGLLTKYNRHTRQEQRIDPWPDNPMGGGANRSRYRFQWTFPIVISPHDPSTLYATANVVFKSTNEGMSWDIISPDLTRDDKSKEESSGGPITKDNTSVEYYCTIYTFAESPVQKGVLWAGSDDGLVHISVDGGASWKNVTPKDLPEWARISMVEASPHDAGTAFVAAKRYEMDDFRPYVFRTTDYGKSWKKIVRGIPDYDFVHVAREDPARKGLLYAGTERGVYVSFDNGESWQPLQLNLPVVPVHDLAIQAREKDLVAATHGRSFWILDDLTLLYQLRDEVANADRFLFQPRDTYRMRGGGFNRPGVPVGKNPPNGAVVYYCFSDKPKGEVKLQFLDEKGTLVKSLGSREERGEGEGARESDEEPGPTRLQRVPADSGMNRFVWDLRFEDATHVPAAVLWGGSIRGPVVVPGTYQVRLIVGGDTLRESFKVKKDARVSASPEDLHEQLDFLLKIRNKVSEAHAAVNSIRDIRKQTEDLVKRAENHSSRAAIAEAVKKMNEKFSVLEEEIIQTKAKSSQDVLNYPIKLNNKLAALGGAISSADARPTKQSYDVFRELSGSLDVLLHKFRQLIETDLPAFNKFVKEQDVPAVILKPEKK